MSLPWTLAAAAAGAGLCLGSYAATTAVRAARAEGALTGRSRCDGCGRPLGFASTIPLASFAVLRGRCAACGARIDPLHLAGEALGGAVIAAPILLLPLERGAPVAALGAVLLAASLYDLKTRRLPDVLTAAAAALCVFLALPHPVVGLISAALAFAVLEALRRGFARARGVQGLGFGDVKLFAALALWLGPLSPWALALASAGGLLQAALTRPEDRRIAFGPAIAAAAFTLGLIRETGLWPSLS